MLLRQAAPEALPRRGDAAAEDHRVGAGEVDVLEDAGCRDREREAVRRDALAGQPHDLARLDVALVLRADQVEGAGLGGDHGRALADAQRQRADAVGIAGGEDALAGEDHDRVRAADLQQRLRDRPRQGRGLRAGDQVQDHLGVRGRREERAARLERGADLARVDEVAVVAQGQRPAAGGEDDRLGVDQQRGAGRGVADVADRRLAGKAREPGLVEDVGDVAHLPLDVDLAVVERGDAGRLLAPVLEGVETEVGEVGGILRIADAEDAAFVREAGALNHWKPILTLEPRDLIPRLLR